MFVQNFNFILLKKPGSILKYLATIYLNQCIIFVYATGDFTLSNYFVVPLSKVINLGVLALQI